MKKFIEELKQSPNKIKTYTGKITQTEIDNELEKMNYHLFKKDNKGSYYQSYFYTNNRNDEGILIKVKQHPTISFDFIYTTEKYVINEDSYAYLREKIDKAKESSSLLCIIDNKTSIEWDLDSLNWKCIKICFDENNYNNYKQFYQKENNTNDTLILSWHDNYYYLSRNKKETIKPTINLTNLLNWKIKEAAINPNKPVFVGYNINKKEICNQLIKKGWKLLKENQGYLYHNFCYQKDSEKILFQERKYGDNKKSLKSYFISYITEEYYERIRTYLLKEIKQAIKMNRPCDNYYLCLRSDFSDIEEQLINLGWKYQGDFENRQGICRSYYENEKGEILILDDRYGNFMFTYNNCIMIENKLLSSMESLNLMDFIKNKIQQVLIESDYVILPNYLSPFTIEYAFHKLGWQTELGRWTDDEDVDIEGSISSLIIQFEKEPKVIKLLCDNYTHTMKLEDISKDYYEQTEE